MRRESTGEPTRPHTHTHKDPTGPPSSDTAFRDAVQAAPSRAREAQAHTREAGSIDGECSKCRGPLTLNSNGFVACSRTDCRTEPEGTGQAFVRHVYREDCELSYVPASKDSQSRPTKGYKQPPINLVLGRLAGAGCDYRPAQSVDEWQAQCPVHEDSRPSVVVRRNGDGSVWLKCWAGCSKESMLAALGLEWRDLWEHSEHDAGRRNGSFVKPLLPPHLRLAMEQLLAADDKKRAA